jgi:tRNA pseudouridine38-40 synthase
VKQRYFIKLAYNGKNYCGWQRQPNGITVQEVLENAFSTLLREKIDITGCGRTDTGVHAKQFFAHFDINTLIQCDLTTFVAKLNAFLPQDIVIYDVFLVENDKHARFSAISRRYEYNISLQKNPFLSDFFYQINFDLNVEKMQQACEILMTYTDFSAFSKSKTQTFTNDCKILQASWQQRPNELVFNIEANRFLRNMVRAIVGTMLEIGQGRLSLEDFKKVIESKNRSNAGTSVPAHALSLVEVKY